MATGYHLSAGKNLHIQAVRNFRNPRRCRAPVREQSPSDEEKVKAEAIKTAKSHLKDNDIDVPAGWDKADWKPIDR